MYNQLVCFVCGSLGASYTLHIKPREKGAYFPFLETHDPPQGARLPVADGLADACRVCHAFLNQQWESFESSKTPPIKRLYWLKRVDNGPFTGAEMRIQGEYAAQVMGLQYHPSGTGTLSPYDYGYVGNENGIAVPLSPSTSKSPAKASAAVATAGNALANTEQDSNGALDLSMTSLEQTALLTHAKAKTAERRDRKNSRSTEKPPSVKSDHHNSRSQDGGSNSVICYVCSKEYPVSLGRFIFAKKYTDDEPFFPFLEAMPCPIGGMPLTKQGLTKACSDCRKTLSRQWRYFESNRFPDDQRVYHINDVPVHMLKRNVGAPDGGSSADGRSSVASQHDSESSSTETTPLEVCYLCTEKFPRSSTKILYTKPPGQSSKHSMYFPFVAHLVRPKDAKFIDRLGRVLTCRACYSYLQRQWQVYQSDSVPIPKRKFLLRPLTESGDSIMAQPETSGQKSTPQRQEAPSPAASVSQPLNIQVSQNSTGLVAPPVVSPYSAGGLLTIAPHLMYAGYYPGFVFPGHPSAMAATAATAATSTPSSSSSSISVQNIKQEHDSISDNDDAPSGSTTPLKIPKVEKTSLTPLKSLTACFLCGFSCEGPEKPYRLGAYPRGGDQDSTTPPFFPFLVECEPKSHSSPMTSDGFVDTCFFCYHSLIQQWGRHENSAETKENKFTRSYNTETFPCLVCEQNAGRIAIDAVDLKKLSGWQRKMELGTATGAGIIVEEDRLAIVCKGCREKLERGGQDDVVEGDIDVETMEDGSVKEDSQVRILLNLNLLAGPLLIIVLNSSPPPSPSL